VDPRFRLSREKRGGAKPPQVPELLVWRLS
jgi:hypothetical protein